LSTAAQQIAAEYDLGGLGCSAQSVHIKPSVFLHKNKALFRTPCVQIKALSEHARKLNTVMPLYASLHVSSDLQGINNQKLGVLEYCAAQKLGMQDTRVRQLSA